MTKIIPWGRLEVVDYVQPTAGLPVIQECRVWVGNEIVANLPITKAKWKKDYSKSLAKLVIELNSDQTELYSRKIDNGSKRT